MTNIKLELSQKHLCIFRVTKAGQGAYQRSRQIGEQQQKGKGQVSTHVET